MSPPGRTAIARATSLGRLKSVLATPPPAGPGPKARSCVPSGRRRRRAKSARERPAARTLPSARSLSASISSSYLRAMTSPPTAPKAGAGAEGGVGRAVGAELAEGEVGAGGVGRGAAGGEDAAVGADEQGGHVHR